ncbi:metal ABC transporter substrate-binding protein [Leptolyngbya sp. AN02str]|uniref:metal ABC transporter substrate-binding protein n=1 Tax=Leptolyngbya sp. AN02str TaxID=3423363 RepID=UPI003D3113A5
MKRRYMPIHPFLSYLPHVGIRLAIAPVLSVLVTGLWLGGCTNSATAPTSNSEAAVESAASVDAAAQGKPIVLTTFTVLADIAQNVAGDRAVVQSLTRPGVEIHDYEPTPSDLVRAQQADLILDNGMGLERWAERFYGSVKDVPRVTVTEGIDAIPISEGPYRDRPNPHAWMSPQNALIYVDNIRAALSELDPDHADVYAANAAAYRDRILAIDETLRAALAKLPESDRFIVTCEGAFTYLAQNYGLQEIYLWAINSDQQGTPQQIRRAIDTVKANQVPVVFCESTVNAGAQQQVAQESGAKFGGVFYVDSLTAAQGDAPTYLKLLEYNVNTLIQGLQEGS